MIALGFFLCLAGFASLAMATTRVRDDLCLKPWTPYQVLSWRTVAILLLLLSWCLAVQSSGWLLGTVRLIGTSHVCAAMVLLLLVPIRRHR